MSLVVKFLTSLLLADFPSGSSINYYKDKLYLIGDDATAILVLDKAYGKLNIIPVFEYNQATRVPKALKPDFETSCIVPDAGRDHLLVLGSASRANRMQGLLVPLEESSATSQATTVFSLTDFFHRLTTIGEINIEGSTSIDSQLVLSNRANSSNPYNTLIITPADFWKQQASSTIGIVRLVIPGTQKDVMGVSELCYVKEKDLLLLTLSTEPTANAYDDGAIGDSYIGWISAISTKLNQQEVAVEGIVNLPQAHKELAGEKIEGITIERVEDDTLITHLVSDNDKGQSRLFKLKITIDK